MTGPLSTERALVLIAAAVGVLFGGGTVLDWLAGLENRGIAPAVIGVAGTLITALSGIWLWNAQARLREREREADAQRVRQITAATSAQRIERVLIALHAEIAFNRSAYQDVFGPAVASEFRERLIRNIHTAAEGQRRMPVTSGVFHNKILEIVSADIPDLPSSIISPLVEFYHYDAVIQSISNAFKSGDYESLSSDRQERILDYYFKTGLKAMSASTSAMKEIECHLQNRGNLSFGDGSPSLREQSLP